MYDLYMLAKSFRISGHVQGVCFRADAQEKAKTLGLTGWVLNDEDGSVRMHTEGDSDALREFEMWCHTGPPSARVESVIVKDVDEEGQTDFDIRF